MTLSKRRVVITGMGMVTPVGLNVEQTWQNILAGKSGVAAIEDFDATDYACKIWAKVKDFDITNFVPAKDARKMDVFTQYGIAAAVEALSDSGLTVDASNATRCGVAKCLLILLSSPTSTRWREGFSLIARIDAGITTFKP